jgi:hypothetical protein
MNELALDRQGPPPEPQHESTDWVSSTHPTPSGYEPDKAFDSVYSRWAETC